MTAGRAFRIRRQTHDGETLHIPATNACRGCYKPIPEVKGVHYCDATCEDSHRRLTARVFACTIDETAP